MAATSALTWSKLVWEKNCKRTILRGL